MCVFVGVLQGMHDMFISPAGGEPSAVLHAPANSGQCLQRKRKLDQTTSDYPSAASSYTVTPVAAPAHTIAAKHLSHQVIIMLRNVSVHLLVFRQEQFTLEHIVFVFANFPLQIILL